MAASEPERQCLMSRRPITTLLGSLVSLSLLTLLSACAQQREPGYYNIPRESTTTDALQRAQGAGSGTAPSQLQFGFGDQNTKPANPAPTAAPATAATPGSPAAPAAGTSAPSALPSVLTETRTYLGTVPCPDSNVCSATRMTLTLAPDGQWRARNAMLTGNAPAQTAMGCWFLTGTDPTRVVLQSGNQAYAALELIQSNVWRVMRLNGQAPLLDARLTRQADIDPIDELASHPAQACPTH
ncbi:MAG TPA: copper resistance protein NlpE N-terminal domain-containing protein [Castellaniella sp.]|uniref:copper resistance protein NlpE N-terminal domain-containing protein n=1 Tax=Castellaniella sp. TaxID=1955812 RepID=UPI002EEB0CAF